ncbi:spindle assembly checkpoint component MAD1 [Polychaeton citri CBS 116435]|uniref:Spindle assembly checkpoint component MAD1 n=1 Tax=Polychaeton citri CBS 116435 TaxID=1314669 RepID=A0A9P4USU2_9PEZI|nr:spindle assembly checkpoint component MAD1 [Polychaeton citri CBS 116435]
MARANQPSYDFLAGAELSPPLNQDLRESAFKHSTAPGAPRADISNENLRAQLNTLQYELDSLKQERELTTLQHEQGLRDAQVRAEADFKRAQAAETAAELARKKAETLQREWQDVKDRDVNEKITLEKKIRALQGENGSLREEVEEANSELASYERKAGYEAGELRDRNIALLSSVEELQKDVDARVSALLATQQRLSRKETELGERENEVLRLKAQAGDKDTLALIKKELSEQVAYIKKLEVGNREQAVELKQFRKTQQSVEVVEEEKRGLEARLMLMEDLRKELGEAQLQRRILEDEKKSWTSYLESESMAGEGATEGLVYETPEEMARAFLQERLERLNLVNKLGSVQPQLSVKDDSIRTLEDDKAKLQSELEKLRISGPTGIGGSISASDAKARARLERQKNLAVKEVEYLRAQIKTLEEEEAEFSPEQVDEARMQRVHELEGLVDQYRSELQSLHTNLSQLESQTPAPSSPRKRARSQDADGDEDMTSPDERVASLRLKAQTLQSDLERLQSKNQMLEADLRATTSQLTSLRESSRTRVLELRDNPTARFEKVQQSTLKTLREENAALLSQLENRGTGAKVVPISTLDNHRLQISALEADLAQREKKMDRLNKVFKAKALEFREAVCSILGWKLDFQPNGRVKATSILYPTLLNPETGEEEENSIVFDGENGTMKVSGGPQSLFASEIRGFIEFWVEGRKEIPCFLAACTLEFADRVTRAPR